MARMRREVRRAQAVGLRPPHLRAHLTQAAAACALLQPLPPASQLVHAVLAPPRPATPPPPVPPPPRLAVREARSRSRTPPSTPPRSPSVEVRPVAVAVRAKSPAQRPVTPPQP